MQFDLRLNVPPLGSRRIVCDLHRQLRSAIVSGRLLPGAQLPPTRIFARQYGVSRSTVTAVYELLLAEGFLDTRQGGGTFVAAKLRLPVTPTASSRRREPRLPLRGARSHLTRFSAAEGKDFPYDLRLGVPDKSKFPFDVWRRLSNRVLRNLARTPATYLNSAGPAAFREAISAHVSYTRAVACSSEHIVATTGAQQAFDLIARTLIDPGETIVAVEDPGYPPARAAFAAAGARLMPVPVDSDGLRVDRLPRNTRVICVTPSHQFPTGAVMSLDRRYELLEFARRNRAIILEDDYDSEFRFGGSPLDALQTLDHEGAVFYVGTFSKSLFPALRLGFLVAPDWARDAVVDTKRIVDWHGPALPQLTLAAFIAEGHLARHVRRMRRIYARRRETLLHELEEIKWLQPVPSAAGLHVAAWLDPRLTENKIIAACAREGIGIEGFGSYAMRRHRSGLVFGIGNCGAEKIGQAIRRVELAAQ